MMMTMSPVTNERIGILILGDQLVPEHPAIAWAAAHFPGAPVQIIFIESMTKTQHLPYHRHKLTLLFSAMRHFAEGLRQQGYDVHAYRRAGRFTEVLRAHITQHGTTHLLMMAGAEYHARQRQTQLHEQIGIPVTLLPNSMFLVSQTNLTGVDSGKRVIMEDFYRSMRRHFNVLMVDTKPVGDKWNFDHDNRKRLPKQVEPPEMRVFPPDDITQTVMQEIEAAGHGVGSTAGFSLAVTHEDAARALDDFIAHRLPLFGDYEDAMSSRHAVLFHSQLSPYLNIGLLDPLTLIRRAEAAYLDGHAPLNAVEGFIRQILGWREYIYWQYWRQMPGLRTANDWEAQRPMPRMFWDGETDMNCVRHVVSRLLENGYSHHIERLMVVCNFCLLAGIDPAQVADWFLTFYIDAYDWVVLPNVIGMGLNADGGKTATKPYIASANYINSMSDYCVGCRFDHKARSGDNACPYNVLYWNFLIEHEARLRANPRSGKNVLGLRHVSEAEKARIREQARALLDEMAYYQHI
jgi:deoxyribodipyrimidine photolyase-related protein